MRAHENQADQRTGEKSPARRASPLGTTADRMLTLQNQAGNAAVSSVVQRRFDPEQHQHGAGCGHDGIDDRSPEGQSQLLAAAKETPSSSLPGSFLAKATSFYQNPKIADGRVHADPIAQRATAAMGAEAMTIGMDVYLGPSAIGNEGILAHEASHLDKNSRGITETGVSNGAGPSHTDPGQDSEVAAVRDSDAFESGVDVAPSVVAQRSAAEHAEDAD
ncbi:DUF4157 domain-containing protein [Strepomyces sp. STD 3.1]|uniref:eCIS core domain-containing protein n=1 Tax=Streptomyces sp. NPDC058985 TaxID=3346684 RepID=UPI001F3CF482|nr:DUF4157 domain-containing protein [Streptomyces sp. STD 3.1]